MGRNFNLKVVKSKPKNFPVIIWSVLMLLFVVGLVFRGITHNYFPAFEISDSSKVSRISTITLFTTAIIFYGLIIPLLLIARRSWTDVFAIGASLFILCEAVNYLIPPVGAVLFVGFHAAWIFIWIKSAVRKTKPVDKNSKS
jgi:Na+/melibiose symporter-like transporter